MKNILVTGGAGFIGSYTSEALINQGDSVIVVDNFNDYYDVNIKKSRIDRFKNKCKLYKHDIADYNSLEEVFKQNEIDQVCHLAAQAGVRHSLTNPFIYEKSNVLGTLNLLELCRKNDINSFIYASSSSVYGGNKKIPFSEKDPVDNPISLYAATKRSTELQATTYSNLYGLHTTGLRFFTVYGPRGRPDMALFKFTEAITNGKPIDVYNNGKMKRDFTYITDIVDGILAALDRDYKNEIFNLGNSKIVELEYFIGEIEKQLGKKAKKNLLPMQPGDIEKTNADISKSKRMLGFNPKVNIEEGIKNFIKWYKDYYNVR